MLLQLFHASKSLFLRNILAFNTVNLLQTEAKLSNAKHPEVLSWCLHAKRVVEEAVGKSEKLKYQHSSSTADVIWTEQRNCPLESYTHLEWTLFSLGCLYSSLFSRRYDLVSAATTSLLFLSGLFRTPRQPQTHTSTDCMEPHKQYHPLPIYPPHSEQWNHSKRNQTQPVFASSKLLSVFQNVYLLGNQHNANPSEGKYLWAPATLGLGNCAHALDFVMPAPFPGQEESLIPNHTWLCFQHFRSIYSSSEHKPAQHFNLAPETLGERLKSLPETPSFNAENQCLTLFLSGYSLP